MVYRTLLSRGILARLSCNAPFFRGHGTWYVSRSNRRAFSKTPSDEDPFGLSFDDSKGKIGSALPPKYKRDAATGRLTGEVEVELTDDDKLLLKADPIEQDALLLKRLEQQWLKDGIDPSGLPSRLNKAGKGIREAKMRLNVLGRSVQAQAAEEELDDGATLGRDEAKFSQNLTQSEFHSFKKFLKDEYDVDVNEEDLPVMSLQKKDRDRKVSTDKEDEEKQEEALDPDEEALALKWLTSRAQRQMDDALDDNPYSDLMPSDLSPVRLVNRKRAKQIPRTLLHHNNVELLQRFLTPTGQIRNRVQTRLGARDQRKVAKLVKRARSLGLIPYMGQFKVERHGWIHDKDINDDRLWEQELERRGLVMKRRGEPEKVDEN